VTLLLRAVEGRSFLRLFRDLPARLYGGDPSFVPMLDPAFHAVMDRRRNPFWRHAERREWLAFRDGKPVGRVGACVDEDLRARTPGCGVFGFFDCADDTEAARALLGTAEAWLRERGCDRARGPLNYSIHDTAGILVEGFGTPPVVDTTWNPPHVPRLLEEAGYRGAQDLLGLSGALELHGPERARRFADRAKRQGASVRPLDLRRFAEEVEIARTIYNAAWDGNWGHVPIGREEFLWKAKDLKAVLDPDLVRIAEADGKPVGFMLALPDLNVAAKASRGHLLPWGWLRLLRARRCGRCRVAALGVLPGYRVRGIEALLLSDSFAAIGDRYAWCESSWVLADNLALLNGLSLYNLRPYKRWRLYERDLRE
jgi:GNAT superfamily N-acetyltransferase